MSTEQAVEKGGAGVPKRIWTACRIIEGRLQFLSGGNWEDLSAATYVTLSREDAWQRARASQGLLIAVDGIPGTATVAGFQGLCIAAFGNCLLDA
jgi:hypothetical protein